MVKRFVQQMLGIDELEKRVADIDQRLTVVEAEERRTQATLQRFGDYKNRTLKELNLMGGQIEDLIDSVQSLVERSESEDGIRRAKRLLARLKNNHTRIGKAKAKGR